MQEAENRTQSEFNMSLHTLGRINYSLFLCSEHFRSMQLSTLFFEMQNLYMETCTEMKGDILLLFDNKEKKDNKELAYMEKLILEIEPLVDKFVSKQRGEKDLNKQLYLKLRYMNMLLRKILKAAGLLMKYQDDAKYALG